MVDVSVVRRESPPFPKKDPSISNAFLILAIKDISFDQFYDLFLLAESLVEQMKDSLLFQLVAFHPQFTFGNVDQAHSSNFSNRSPYPMIHILRVDEVEEAIRSYGDIDHLLEKNQQALQKWLSDHGDSAS